MDKFEILNWGILGLLTVTSVSLPVGLLKKWAQGEVIGGVKLVGGYALFLGLSVFAIYLTGAPMNSDIRFWLVTASFSLNGLILLKWRSPMASLGLSCTFLVVLAFMTNNAIRYSGYVPKSPIEVLLPISVFVAFLGAIVFLNSPKAWRELRRGGSFSLTSD